MTRSYQEYLDRQRQRWGDRFDPGDLRPDFVPYFESGERVKVAYTIHGGPNAGDVLCTTGTIGVTTGWRPAFLLMVRRTSIGSSYVIGSHDKVVAVKRGRKYAEVA